MSKNKIGPVWQDREVLFDLPFSYLKLRASEKIFDRIEPIEDTKGNSGAKGRMVFTNLRIIWHSFSSPRINLSIGLNCVMSTSTKVVNSGLRGTTQALYVLATFKGNKYEFVFTDPSPNCVRHYPLSEYTKISYYNNQISIYEHSVWNLSSESGNLGSLLAHNVRIVWYADINEAFNVSMPYLHHHRESTVKSIDVLQTGIKNAKNQRLVKEIFVKWGLNSRFTTSTPMAYQEPQTISIKNSKFGEALVIVTHTLSGRYVLGFRVDSPDRLQALLTELQTLHQAYIEKPTFGVEMNWGTEAPKSTSDEIEELEEIGEPRGEMGHHLYLAAQLAQNKKDSTIQPVYFNKKMEGR